MIVSENVKLASHTTLGVGGIAKYFAKIRSVADVKEALNFTKKHKLPFFILGGGSNIVISDKGHSGLVLKVEIKGISILKRNKSTYEIRVGAGENWDKFVLYCIKNKLGGVECLSGIPGSVGASPIQNIGAYGQEVKDVIKYVEVIDLNTSKCRKITNKDCKFGYRDSCFKSSRDLLVTHVVFKLQKGKISEFKYQTLTSHFIQRKITLQSIRRFIIKTRKTKSMVYSRGDIDSHSTGSFFVNPIISHNKLFTLRKKYPDIPYWDLNKSIKVPAAWLIEHSGFKKGFKYGKVRLSKKHALAIVNPGKASARDVYAFSKNIAKKVFFYFKIKIHPESEFVGKFI